MERYAVVHALKLGLPPLKESSPLSNEIAERYLSEVRLGPKSKLHILSTEPPLIHKKLGFCLFIDQSYEIYIFRHLIG